MSLFLLLSLVIVVGPGITGSSMADPVASLEYRVKAAFIFNFAKFVEWPAAAYAGNRGELTIGILGDDPFGRILDLTVEGKTVGGRRVRIRRCDSVDDVKGCQILFISLSEDEHLPQITEKLKGMPVLTVSELDSFTQKDGIVKFFMEDNKVRFEINIDQATRSGLKISSQLLYLAHVIRD